MGDLGADTAVAGGDGTYTATISDDWRIWGPQGGYIASVALRAAGAECGRAKPASINAHFCRSAAFAPVTVRARVLRETRVASVVDVEIEQDEQLMVKATVWGVDVDDGLEHTTADRPEPLPDPDTIPPTSERMADADAPVFPFWHNLDTRSPYWVDDWDNRPALPAVTADWARFTPTGRFDDPWLDPCRALILIDVGGWPAAVRPHTDELDWFAPTTEVTVRFIGDTRNDEWLQNWAWAPVASGGLIGARGEIWTGDGRLLALGGSTLLCRPSARRPDA